ncbi:hypothetical protein [uncultured Meiothermus sp.]|jgi:hypothetical protein|uniref:hypothetical protein n=1 Tax=uncultured Meiothermus sp. TaxID=157471 RepID=UPI00261A5CC3|nr:hypothetical protein [uncultured Meiothermus sp.]
MPTTVWALVRKGKIEPDEALELPEGTKVLVTALTDVTGQPFWLRVSKTSLEKTWDHSQDNVYAELLQR